MDNITITGERLKELMRDENLTASGLAGKINFSRTTLSLVLNGAHAPSTELLISLAQYFNCSADYLLGRTDIPKDCRAETNEKFCEILRKCLTESGKTEYRFQKDLKLSRSLTYRWLKGKAVPEIDSLTKLADYFSCSVDYLLGIEN